MSIVYLAVEVKVKLKRPLSRWSISILNKEQVHDVLNHGRPWVAQYQG